MVYCTDGILFGILWIYAGYYFQNADVIKEFSDIKEVDQSCLTRCREMVSEPDHFSFRSDFLEKYLSDLKNFSSFENVVCSSFQFCSLKFWKKSKLSNLIVVISSFRKLKTRKQGRKYDSAYRKTQFSEKIQENEAIKQKWSGSLTISRQRLISASRQRVKINFDLYFFVFKAHI